MSLAEKAKEIEKAQKNEILSFYNDSFLDLEYLIQQRITANDVKYIIYTVPSFKNSYYSKDACARILVKRLREEGLYAKKISQGKAIYASWDSSLLQKTSKQSTSSIDCDDNDNDDKPKSKFETFEYLDLGANTDRLDILNFFVSPKQ